MVINFNRARTQKEIETIIDVNYDVETATAQEQKIFRQSVEEYALTQLDVTKLTTSLTIKIFPLPEPETTITIK